MSQCSYCLFFHDKINHRCSKDLADKNGVPKVGDGDCEDDEPQGKKYCPSKCYECKERDPKLSAQKCKQDVEEFKTINDKKFYTGRPLVKECETYDPIHELTEGVID